MSFTTKHQNFFNEKLYCYSFSNNAIHKIQHNHKIVKITSMGENVCFANEMNEIYKIHSVNTNNGTRKKLNPEISTTIIAIDNPPLNIPIKFFLAGYFHLIVILENNLIYGHGSADNGQLGVNSGGKIEKLKLIDTTNVFKTINESINKTINERNGQLEITHACCGTYSTVIVVNNKEIWYCGKFIDDLKHDFTKINFKNNNVNDNVINDVNDNVIVKNISAGYGHLLVLTNKNELFVYGDNEYGQLIKDGPSNELTKLVGDLSFLNGSTILNAFAVRLSHLSVIISNSLDIYIFGYFGDSLGGSLTNDTTMTNGKVKLIQSILQKKNNLKEINERTSVNIINTTVLKEEEKERYNKYSKGEISIYGGFSSMIFVDNLKRNIWLGGMRGNYFTNETFHLKEIDKELFTNLREQVLDVVVGSNVYGVLVGMVNLLNEYMLNNLKKMVDCCCKRIVMNESEENAPFSDIEIVKIY